MPVTAAVEALARRDRLIVVVGLVAVTTIAWVYLVHLVIGMEGMQNAIATIALPAIQPWTMIDFALMFFMWVMMMAAMMTPSAAPMILLYAAIIRKSSEADPPVAASSIFAAGYLVIWIGFSAVATGLQWGLEQVSLLSPMMVGTSPYFGAALLIAAGAYQMTPLKEACLQHCRSPVHFLTSHWRKGAGGAFRIGIDHGVYCVGCCWVLMALLFVGGVMNLLWIAALAIFVLMEKFAPRGALFGRMAGGLMVLGGLGLIV